MSVNKAPIQTETSPVNPFQALEARIERIKLEVEGVKTYHLRLLEGQLLGAAPGRFTMLSLPGIGECPISISSMDGGIGLQHTIRKAGRVTGAIYGLQEGESIWVRGCYGRGWPLKELEGRDLALIAGGIGLAPLRPLLEQYSSGELPCRSLTLLYGAKDPGSLLYSDEWERWRQAGARVLMTVDRGGDSWKGNLGVVTTLCEQTDCIHGETVALVCGPEVMMSFVVLELLKSGMREELIHISLERRMDCALGICGHCQLGPKYVCKDGPVFPYSEVKNHFGAVS